MKRFVEDVLYGLIAAVLIFLLWLATVPMVHAEESELQVVPFKLPCLDEKCTHVAVPTDLMDALAQHNNALAKQVLELEAKVKSPRCAEVEVVPKPEVKPAPKLKPSSYPGANNT